jgi:SAM-dependent methyltransferase
MFSLAFLDQIRAAELAVALPFLPAGSRVLEIGAGTGFLSQLLHDRGYSVECVDLPGSTYEAHRVYPVRNYDGITLPFADDSFDVVFSSSVLEHVANLALLSAEMRRVLKPGGRGVHLMPTTAWRLWSLATHYPNLPVLFLFWAAHHGHSPFPTAARRSTPHLLGRALWPGRHGETGTALGEIRLFSRSRWLGVFRKMGWKPMVAQSTGLFYTGNMLLGPKVPIVVRRRLGQWLGSGSALYVVEM